MSLSREDSPYQRQHAAAGREVAGRLGVDVQVQFAKNNEAVAQSEQLLNTIQSTAKEARPNGIICAPVGTTLSQVAHQAVAAGIGWAVLNRDADYIGELRKNSSVPVFTVSTDQEAIGRIQGLQIAALLPEGGLVLYLLGPSGNAVMEKRLAGMMHSKPANVEVKTLTGQWSESSGYRAVSRWLQLRTQRDRAIDLVAAQNDDMAVGARKALQENTKGEERERWLRLPYVGCDCCPGAGVEWVHQGLLTCSVINPPTGGPALQMMVKALQTNERPPEFTTIPPESHPAIEKLREKAPRSR
jgi:ribose transport system substrate-binding protein